MVQGGVGTEHGGLLVYDFSSTGRLSNAHARLINVATLADQR